MNAKPPTSAPDTRFFSLDEAERMLPLVRRIVADIVAEYEAIEPLVARLDVVSGQESPGDAADDIRARIEAGAARMDELVAELHELGCLFKGPREGLVDWYSYYAGRPVFLCWKRGEESIGWWHQVDAGFAGRQPVLDSQRGSFVGDPPAS